MEDAYQPRIVRLHSGDGRNCLARSLITSLIAQTQGAAAPLIITGNERFFSVGADLNEIAKLTAPDALDFARLGQQLMNTVAAFPGTTIAAIQGYCMGGGLDLALACSRRIAAPNAIFAHRGAALGLMTGWGGTQRLVRLIGKGRALQMFLAAEKLTAVEALRIGLIDAIVPDPVAEAVRLCRPAQMTSP